MNGNESYLERERRRIREFTERLKKMNAKAKAYNLLVDLAGDELESAYNVYVDGTKDFGGDSVQAWQEFERHMQKAAFNFRCAIETLHKLAEISPSDVQPGAYKEIESLIDKAVNMRILYWERWGKRMQPEADARQRPTGVLTCPSLLYHRGVKDMTKMSAEDAEWCDKECPYRDRCELPVPRSKR